ncbi:bilirubin oxidase [Apiospora rasikravindrae]|uniref:Bilirubin oxidase n=1 Tax=Apiospora rasikravindrae TaxID=990691 RepID=A0ABR1RXX2_9PEZI
MLPNIRSLGLVACLIRSSVAQTNQTNGRGYTYNIPLEEAQALSHIVEDDPDEIFTILKDGGSPEYPIIYRVPLPIPPVKQPKMTVANPVTGKDIWYYELETRLFTQQVYPNLGPATLVGYDGMSPGPTFIVPRGTETVVRIMNNAELETSVHLHGSPSRAPFDGWAPDVTQPGEYKDYYWPNEQSGRMLWYHDHAEGITSLNANSGQAGAYILTDPAEDALGLPSGYGEYDIPLVLTSKHYNQDGTLKSTVGEAKSYWGDVIQVNGQPWPFLAVEPRKYRFRFLNAAVSRSFALYFVRAAAPDGKLPFQVIASDAGLLAAPVPVSDMYVAMAERYEIVFDFSAYAGESLELRNLNKVGGIGTDDDYAHTNQVMRFVVGADPVPDNSTVPARLRDVPFPPSSTGIDHHFRFHRSQGEWRINGVGFADVENRVLAHVPRGTVELWELENASGGWSHPIHVHLVDFRVLDRYGDEANRGVMPYESQGLKDVVWLGRHETVLVEAHYRPWDGVYMFHCHNLIHEDHDMMAAFNVTALDAAALGYNATTDFADPMDPRWRARPYSRADFTARSNIFSEEAIRQAVTRLALEQPYSEREAVEEAVTDYWSTHEQGNSNNPVTLGQEQQAPVSSSPGLIPRYRRFRV